VKMNSPPVFSGVRDTRSLVLCVCFVDRFFFPFFFLAIVLSVLLQLKDSDYTLVSSHSSKDSDYTLVSSHSSKVSDYTLVSSRRV
jgi:hypothetical protein